MLNWQFYSIQWPLHIKLAIFMKFMVHLCSKCLCSYVPNQINHQFFFRKFLYLVLSSGSAKLRLSPAEVLTGALARSWELLQALVKSSINSVSNKRSADMKPANTWFSFWSMAWSFACVNFFINFVALGLDVNVRACGFDCEEENWVWKCLGKFLNWRIAGGCTCSSPILYLRRWFLSKE